MNTNITETQVTHTKKLKKLKPARKQVKPGDVEKKEAPQTGKEYSAHSSPIVLRRTSSPYLMQISGTTSGLEEIERIVTPSKPQSFFESLCSLTCHRQQNQISDPV